MADELPPGMPEDEPGVIGEVTEETTSQEPAAPSEPEDEEQHFIKLDRRKWPEELSRLEREDNHFKEVFRSRIGKRAERIYKPQLQEWEYKYNQLNENIQRNQITSVPQAELAQRLLQDPNFAQQYHQLQNPDPSRDLVVQVDTGIARIISRAIDAGLPDEKAEELVKEVYDNKYGDATIQDFFNQFENRVFSETVNYLKNTGTQTQEVPPVQTQANTSQAPVTNAPNLALAAGAPVGNGTRGKAGIKYTKEQVLNWQATDPERYFREFPHDDDFETAVAAGQIAGMGPNS